MLECDRLVVCFGNFERVELGIDRCVWCDLTAIDDLHRSHPREYLRDGPGAKERLVGLNRHILAPKCVAVAARVDLVAVDDGDRQSARVVFRQCTIGRIVDERIYTSRLCLAGHTTSKTACSDGGAGASDCGLGEKLTS